MTRGVNKNLKMKLGLHAILFRYMCSMTKAS